MSGLAARVLKQTQKAMDHVYELFGPTPMQALTWPKADFRLFLKREDLSPIHSFKWRGAYHALRSLCQQDPPAKVVAASAGNHAQGLAASAHKLGILTEIFMPKNASQIKKDSVKNWGQGNVRLVLRGQSYDEAAQAARDYHLQTGCPLIHPYDDEAVMAGQATGAVESVLQMAQSKVDTVFLPIGGGGLAAGWAVYLKTENPQIRIIGVETQGQACMHEAFKQGVPLSIGEVDSFCDGTAVSKPGQLCYEICREFLDDVLVVSQNEVLAAMYWLWQSQRILPEPSGALGVAGLFRCWSDLTNQTVLLPISGANMDLTLLNQVLHWAGSKPAAKVPACRTFASYETRLTG